MSWFMELHTLLTPMMLNERREGRAIVEVRAEVIFHDSFDSLYGFPQSHLDSGSKHIIRAVLQFLSCSFIFIYFLQQNVYSIFRFYLSYMCFIPN